MSRRERCKSKWNKITVVDDNNIEIITFPLNELGQLEIKLKTQNRRRIHEGRRARKIPDQPEESSPKTILDEIPLTNDQFNSQFINLQSSSETDNSSLFLFDENPDFLQPFSLKDSEDMYDSNFDFNFNFNI